MIFFCKAIDVFKGFPFEGEAVATVTDEVGVFNYVV